MKLEMSIMNKFYELCCREKPPMYEKSIIENGEIATNTTKTKKIKKYDYYICDYCDKEIKIEDKWEKSSGGICKIPKTITKGKKLILALHNKCINQVIQEIKKQI